MKEVSERISREYNPVKGEYPREDKIKSYERTFYRIDEMLSISEDIFDQLRMFLQKRYGI